MILDEEKVKSFLGKVPEGYELEVRIGKFIGSRFESTVTKKVFETIRMAHEKFKHDKYNSTDYFFENNIRKTVMESGETFYMEKVRKSTYDIYDYGMRIASSSEKKVNFDETDKKPLLVRQKNRTRYYILEDVVLDITIVKQNEQISYEIEIEFLKIPKYEVLYNVLRTFLTTRDSSYEIIKTDESNKVIDEYNKLLTNRVPALVGVQAVTLQVPDLRKIQEGYAVTDKADGERCSLFIYNGGIYCIFFDLSVVKIGKISESEFDKSIIDVEKVKQNFYAFDLLVLKGKDIREDNNFKLFDRLGWTQRITNLLSKHLKIYNIKVFTKNFYRPTRNKTIFEIAYEIISNKEKFPYELDGLIFTPYRLPYPKIKKWPSLLKWKFEHMITIDMRISKVTETNWNLFVYDGKTDVPFEPVTDFDKIYVSPIESMKYDDGSIVEFAYNKTTKKLYPIRQRYDKIKPNFKDIAYSNYENMLYPVTMNILKELAENKEYKEDIKSTIPGKPIRIKDDLLNEIIYYNKLLKTVHKASKRNIENLRKHHNNIKTQLIENVATSNNVKSLLSIASGKGGDLAKWKKSGISKVIGIDKDSGHVQEAKTRKEKAFPLDDYTFEVADVSDELISTNEAISTYTKEYLSKYTFDAVECNFALHYFLKDKNTFDNFMLNVTQYLKKDGVFYGTFMDGSMIHAHQGQEIKNEGYFKIIKNYNYLDEYDKLDLFGNAITVELNASTIQRSNEYLVKKELFKYIENTYGMQLIELKPFSKYKASESIKLSDGELEFSNFGVSFIMRYIGGLRDAVINITEAMNAVTVSDTVSRKVWKSWAWEPTKQLAPDFFFTKSVFTVNDAYLKGEYNTQFPYIGIKLSNMKSEIHEKEITVYNIVETNVDDSIEIAKNKIINGLNTPFYIFVVIERGNNKYMLPLAINIQGEKNVEFTKVTFNHIDKIIDTKNAEGLSSKIHTFTEGKLSMLKREELIVIAKDLNISFEGSNNDIINRILQKRI